MTSLLHPQRQHWGWGNHDSAAFSLHFGLTAIAILLELITHGKRYVYALRGYSGTTSNSEYNLTLWPFRINYTHSDSKVYPMSTEDLIEKVCPL
ncbi:hypothetical protein DQ04_03721030 [Trypanosoma grayi]|uniref:hypothetical protein n=1 Tax=Trypanosoma grayi TaxID=71804 RepID=UPI0004F498DF|nr:hypothetical protein DQ04_03721030 [Trypanosoma grayi]KEG10430.1 hypothetical protein DQ04_03721030 [Trypanosoma grayi]